MTNSGRFEKGHVPWSKGKKLPEMRLIQTGETNSNWKGKGVKYTGIHEFVRRHLAKPELCEKCNEVPPYDLANISGQYSRDLNDWQWLCRKCHMKDDGRLEKFYKMSSKPFGITRRKNA